MAKGRKPKNVDFLNTLKKVCGFEQVSEFAKACGKKTSNMSRYLKGTLKPGDSILRTSVSHLGEWSVEPRLELQRIPENLSTLPSESGLYILFGSGGQILYLGKATNLRAEVRQTLNRAVPTPIRFSPHLKKKHRPKLRALTTHISAYVVTSARLRHNLEALLLRVAANQTHNQNFGNFK